jgi:hypothetical protein
MGPGRSHSIRFLLSLFEGEADRERSETSLKVLLSALVNINLGWLEGYHVPYLYDSGIRYQQEAPGQEDWQDIPTCLALGYGDCEDLACYRVAELRYHGINATPMLRHRVQRIRGQDIHVYHVLVAHPDGSIEDPSKALGMGSTDYSWGM